MTITRAILILCGIFFVGQLGLLYPSLPETVATHFDGRGMPNGWMSKEIFLIFELGLVVFVIGQFLLVPLMIRNMPRSLINLPNKDYWLSDDHREETFLMIRGNFEVFGSVILILIIVVNQMVYSANIAGKNLSSAIWYVIVAFLLFTAIWLINIFRQFKLPS